MDFHNELLVENMRNVVKVKEKDFLGGGNEAIAVKFRECVIPKFPKVGVLVFFFLQALAWTCLFGDCFRIRSHRMNLTMFHHHLGEDVCYFSNHLKRANLRHRESN